MNREEVALLKRLVKVLNYMDVKSFATNTSWDARTAVPDGIKLLEELIS